MRIGPSIAIAILPITAAAPSLAAANAMQTAIERFRAQDKVPANQAFTRDTLGPAATRVFTAALAQCREGKTGPVTERIGIVLVLDAQGTAAEVVMLQPTPLHRCIADNLQKATYPVPPDIPFYYPLLRNPPAALWRKPRE